MREQDRDLILAFVAGELTDPSDALALIDGSEEARHEYETQLAVRESLQSVEPVTMSATEKAAIRRDTWTALRTETATPLKSPWYYRWVPVAAAGVLAVGVTGVLVQQDDADEAATFQEVASNLSGDGDSSITTAADAAPTEAASGEAAGGAAESEEAETVADLALYSAAIIELRDELSTGDDARLFSRPDDEELVSCLERSGLVDHVLVELLEPPRVPGEEPIIVAAPAGVDAAEAPLTLVSADTCEIVTIDNPADS